MELSGDGGRSSRGPSRSGRRRRARRAAARAARRSGGRRGRGGRRCRRRTCRAMRPASSTSTRSASDDRLVDVVRDQQHRRLGAAAHSSRSSPCIRMRVSASSAPNGSSASSSCGSRTSDRASATRCCSPPDSSRRPGALAAGQPDLGQRLGPALAAASAARRPRVTLSSTRRHGSSRESWKTTDTRSGTAIAPVPATSWSSPASARSRVLLPEPLRPSSATNSPGRDVEVEAVERRVRARPNGPRYEVRADRRGRPATVVSGQSAQCASP